MWCPFVSVVGGGIFQCWIVNRLVLEAWELREYIVVNLFDLRWWLVRVMREAEVVLRSREVEL